MTGPLKLKHGTFATPPRGNTMEHIYLLLSYMKPTTLAQMYDDISEMAFTSEAGQLATAIRRQLIALVGEDEANVILAENTLQALLARARVRQEADEAAERADWYAPNEITP